MNLQSLLRCEPQRVVPPKTALEEIEEQRIIAAAKLRQVSTMIGGPKTLHDRSTTGEKAVHVIRLGMAPHCVVPHCRWTHPSKALLRRVPLLLRCGEAGPSRVRGARACMETGT
jgi:hypothetical protein